MPQESPTVSLVGQQHNSSVDVGAAQIVGDAPLVYEYGETHPLGASQESTVESATFSEKFDPCLPNGALLLPPVSVAIGKECPALQPHQLFEGTVTDVADDFFWATLTDKTTPSNPDENVKFDCHELSLEDRGLVSRGSVFYWIIGKERTVGGQIKNISIVQFRRVPAWTGSAIAQATERAQRLRELFGGSDEAGEATENR